MVIGKTGRDIRQKDAMDFVAGYTLALDMTARTFQVSPNLLCEYTHDHCERLKQRRLDYRGPSRRVLILFVQWECLLTNQ